MLQSFILSTFRLIQQVRRMPFPGLSVKMFVILYVVGIILSAASSIPFNKIKREIESYRGTTDKIISLLVNGTLRHDAYNRLATFVDKFGPRPTGSISLEESIDYLIEELEKGRLENVHTEPAMVTHWNRGEESAELITPRTKKINVKALGTSIGTPKKGIRASAVVVESFDDLEKRGNEVKDKIVVYNQKYISYAVSKLYRTSGAAEASKYGAVAALVKSVTPFSIYSPHVGYQEYEEGIKKIPVASVTVEDAEMMHRMQKRGEKLNIKLKLGAKNYPKVESRNVIAEIIGYAHPKEVVIICAHVDTWDISEGAMDDASGVFIAIEALLSLVELNLRPKRTIRIIFYTGEETGNAGAKAYYEAHKDEIENIVLAMEADEGIFKPLGLKFQGGKGAEKIMRKVLKLLSPINATKLRNENVNYADLTYIVDDGVPGATLWTTDQNDKYFYFHHTEADTVTIIDPDYLDSASALWATVAYVVADMDEKLPTLMKMNKEKTEVRQISSDTLKKLENFASKLALK